LLFGGKFEHYWVWFELSLTFHSITKLMGESFKLHSQALIGYEDAMMAEAEAERMRSSPDATIAPHAAEVAAY
jgi:hypothetical protein